MEALIRKKLLWFTPDIESELKLFKHHFYEDLKLDNPKLPEFVQQMSDLKKAEDFLYDDADDAEGEGEGEATSACETGTEAEAESDADGGA